MLDHAAEPEVRPGDGFSPISAQALDGMRREPVLLDGWTAPPCPG
jgi:hypothetical protein